MGNILATRTKKKEHENALKIVENVAHVNRDSTQIHVHQLGTASVMHEFMAVIFANLHIAHIFTKTRTTASEQLLTDYPARGI